MRQHPGLLVFLFAGTLAAGAIVGCRDEAATEPEVTGVQLARSSSEDPAVTGTDPTGAPQDTTLDVEVSGSGFDHASTVELTLSGTPTEKVRTNSTRYRNQKTLIANITIAADADVDLYDVEVTTLSGKKGIGTEMFEVTSTQIVTFTFRDGSDPIFGDGRVMDAALRTTYTTGECGVNAILPGYNGNAYLRTMSNTIKKDEATACGGTDHPRVFKVSFKDNRLDNGEPLDWDDLVVDAIWLDVYYDIRTIPRGDTEPRKLRIIFNDQSRRGGGGNGWGLACPQGLRFDEQWGASEVQVTRLKQLSLGDGYDEWKIEAVAPNDVAACFDGKSQLTLVGYYRMPFQVTVECRGGC